MSPDGTTLSSASEGLSQAESDARDIAMLRELADITMDLSRALGRLALDKAAEGDAKAAGDLGAVVTRVGRALRQTIAYRRKIEDQVREGESKRSAEQAGRGAAAKRDWSLARKRMIEHAVERVIARQETDDEDDDDENDDLGGDLYERLDEYERFTDFTDRPVSAFVATLCDAMGLEFDWSQFAHDAWAVDEAETQPDGSPFAEWWNSVRGDAGDNPPEAPELTGTGPPLAAE
jgi:hypothetical protein